jgi:hypothetical protein
MAITRAQIPEQIDVFENGGGADSSLSQQDIMEMYAAAATSQPITAQDVQAEMENLQGLFPQPRKANFFDLASEIGAGLVSGAAQPGGFGVGLTAGLQNFNRKASEIKALREKAKQDLTMLAYQQVQRRREEQASFREKALDINFDLMVEEMKNSGDLFGGTSTPASAWNYILSKIDRTTGKYKMIPDGQGGMKPYDPEADPYYRVAKAELERAKTEMRNEPGKGQVQVTTPGFDVDAILKVQKPIPTKEAIDDLRKNPNFYDEFVKYYGKDAVPEDLRQ